MARAPRAADLRPSLNTPPPIPSDVGHCTIGPVPTAPMAASAVPPPPQPPPLHADDAPIHPRLQLHRPTEGSLLDMRGALQQELLETAVIHARWLPSTEVFDFSFDEATTVLALKAWLSSQVGCSAQHMHIVYALTQMRDEIPFSQYVRHGETVLAKPKRGG